MLDFCPLRFTYHRQRVFPSYVDKYAGDKLTFKWVEWFLGITEMDPLASSCLLTPFDFMSCILASGPSTTSRHLNSPRLSLYPSTQPSKIETATQRGLLSSADRIVHRLSAIKMGGRNINKAVTVNSRRLRSTETPRPQPQEHPSEVMTVTASALHPTTTGGGSHSDETSLLLEMLPAETRENIWIRVVTTSLPIHSNGGIQGIHNRLENHGRSKKPFMGLPAEKNILAIARTCKQIRNEVMPIYVSVFLDATPPPPFG